MKIKHLLTLIAVFAASTLALPAQSLNVRRETEKANKETIPATLKTIEESLQIKVAMEVDAASLGEDLKAWNNLYLACNRISGAITTVGSDALGKAAFAKGLQKIVLRKITQEGKDEAVLKDGVLTVQTTFSDDSSYTLQEIIKVALEKAL